MNMYADYLKFLMQVSVQTTHITYTGYTKHLDTHIITVTVCAHTVKPDTRQKQIS